jgi:type IV secretion system protein VirB9
MPMTPVGLIRLVRGSARWLMVSTVVVSTPAFAQLAPAASVGGVRTIEYHPRDLVPVHAKMRFTTLIALPEGEDIVEATCGDKEFWLINARGTLAYVKPAKPGGDSNLNLLTTSGRVYTFLLSEVSATKGVAADLAVYLETADGPSSASAGAGGAHDVPPATKYVLASQLEEVRAQAELARDDLRREAETARTQLDTGLAAFRASYPLSLEFPYALTLNRRPFFVRAMFHDDHATYIQTGATELPAVYEVKDGTPTVVNFEVHHGVYVVPKVLDTGYLALGTKRLTFTHVDAQEPHR